MKAIYVYMRAMFMNISFNVTYISYHAIKNLAHSDKHIFSNYLTQSYKRYMQDKKTNFSRM